jgi:hypothetical protein
MVMIIHKEHPSLHLSKFNIQKYCHIVSLWNNKEMTCMLHISESLCCLSHFLNEGIYNKCKYECDEHSIQ